MKKCTTCKVEKEPKEFGKYNREPDGLQNKCRKCKTEYERLDYLKNKGKNLSKKNANSKRSRAKRKVAIDKIKSVPCKDCKIQYNPWVMQFDHLCNKTFDIGRSNGYKFRIVLEEINKCEIVCANCHAERTYSRLNSL